MIFVFDRFRNIVRKGENAGYQHFLLFLQCFQKGLYRESLKVGIVGKELTLSQTNPGFNVSAVQVF